ncbi:MAG: hypothetical protein M1835_003905 [Candelina submexicana]|nr:MAG: hypothetical protein M1835_003905 [Candelina submexicana]
MTRKGGSITVPPPDTVSASALLARESAAPSVEHALPLRCSDVLLEKRSEHQAVRRWNTKNLGQRLASDALAAACAGALVAPIITIIDRGIIENASGRSKLMTSISTSMKKLITRPHEFVISKPFSLIFALYFGTYITANLLDTMTSTITNSPASSVTAGPAKFIATSSANLSLCLYKDSRFTRLYGPPGIPRPVPPASYLLFALRDSMTIFASFNLPPLVAPLLPISEVAEGNVSKLSVAQFVAPAAAQLVSTPLHLLGLDLYNRPRNGVSGWQRWGKVRRDWGLSTLARMCRIVPAFGVGGVVNMRVRKGLIGSLE